MTLEYIKNISTFIVFAAIVRFASEYLGSDYLILLLVLVHSPIFMALFTYSKSLVEILLIAVFIASLYNLYDTANSIFIILNNEDAH